MNNIQLINVNSLFVTVSWHDDSSLRHNKKKRTFCHFQYGERSMSEVFRKVERNGSSGVRRESIGAYVPLSAWTHQFVLETDASKRLYILVAK